MMKSPGNTVTIPGSDVISGNSNCYQEAVNWKGKHWSMSDGEYGNVNPTPLTRVTWTYGDSGNTKTVVTSRSVIYLIKY